MTKTSKRPPRVDATLIGSKKIEFQHNQFDILQELDAMSETIRDIIQQSTSIE